MSSFPSSVQYWYLTYLTHVVFLFSEKSFVDASAIKQLESVAALPGVRLAVGMPDLHPGSRFPIGEHHFRWTWHRCLNCFAGCAIAADGIYPALIGSDVGCGIGLYRLSASASRAKANPKKFASLLKNLDEPWSGSTSEWLARYGIKRTSQFDQASLGTVGSGNHFAEICTPERIVDLAVAASLNIDEDALYLLGKYGKDRLTLTVHI